MNDPELYKMSTNLREHEKEVLEKYSQMIHWRTDRQDSLLDVGCAGGDITNDLIIPFLPDTFSRVVGVDLSENMVKYANENYATQKVTFEKLDISGDVGDFLQKHGQFDHVTSFLCLNIIPEQKTAMENIYKLLKPNGDILFYIIGKHRRYDMYYILREKWNKYLTKVDVDNAISPYHHHANPAEMLTSLLKDVGFRMPYVEVVEKMIYHHDRKKCKDAIRSVLPFMSKIPNELQDEFLEDFVDLAATYEKTTSDDTVVVEWPCHILLAHASKNVMQSCGGVARENGTYFVNPNHPDAYEGTGSCQLTIMKSNPDICQIRLDLDNFAISQPEPINHICNADQFLVSGGSPAPAICHGELEATLTIVLASGDNNDYVNFILTLFGQFFRKNSRIMKRFLFFE